MPKMNESGGVHTLVVGQTHLHRLTGRVDYDPTEETVAGRSIENPHQWRRILASPMITLATGLALTLPLVGAWGCQEAFNPRSTEEANTKTLTIPIEGMSCSACAAQVKETLMAVSGVSEVQVNLAERNARVRFAPTKVSADRLVSAIDGLGYDAGEPEEVK